MACFRPGTWVQENGRRPIDPRRSNIAVDANALDCHGADRDSLVTRLKSLIEEGKVNIVAPGGVREEAAHPKTPVAVKAAVMPRIFNLRPGLNTQQQAERRRVALTMQGNAAPDKHAADASHLSEAAETGCCYFITEDARILKKRTDLASVLPPTPVQIVTLAEFLEIFDDYEQGRRLGEDVQHKGRRRRGHLIRAHDETRQPCSLCRPWRMPNGRRVTCTSYNANLRGVGRHYCRFAAAPRAMQSLLGEACRRHGTKYRRHPASGPAARFGKNQTNSNGAWPLPA